MFARARTAIPFVSRNDSRPGDVRERFAERENVWTAREAAAAENGIKRGVRKRDGLGNECGRR